MGCDIHLYFEERVEDKWEPIYTEDRILPDDRDYELFHFLAGVRSMGGEVKAQFPGRGIPEDTSLPTGDYAIYIGDHSFTYAYLDEIVNAPWKEADLEGCYFHVFCAQVLPRIADVFWKPENQYRNVRVVMGFDS